MGCREGCNSGVIIRIYGQVRLSDAVARWERDK